MSALTVAEVLERAADLLEKPGAWTQGGAGRDRRGYLVQARNIDRAVCFCGVGAVWKAVGAPFEEVKDWVIYECFPPMNKAVNRSNCFGHWNDTPGRTQAEVVAALRSAAVIAAGGGS